MAHGLSCSDACRILVPGPGIKPVSSELVGEFLTTGPTVKSCSFFPIVDSSFIALWSEKIFLYDFTFLNVPRHQFKKIKIKCTKTCFGAYQAEEAEVDQFYEDL